MNALEFIDKLLKDGTIVNMNAKTAYELFSTTVGKENAGTYGYFRTKFNNTVKSLGVGEATKNNPVINYDAQKAKEEAQKIADAILEELPELQTKNYKSCYVTRA